MMKFAIPAFCLLALTALPAAAEESHSGFGSSFFAEQGHPGFSDPANPAVANNENAADMDGIAQSLNEIAPAAGDEGGYNALENLPEAGNEIPAPPPPALNEEAFSGEIGL